MSTKFTFATVALAVSLPLAAFASQGSDQLAKIAGVPTGEYSNAELVLIDAARDGQDDEYLNFLLSHGASGEVSRTSVGAVTQAKVLGIAPGSLSVADMIILDDAIRENDEDRIAFQLAKIDPSVSRSNSVDGYSAGHLQIAKIAGVDPDVLSTSDLNRLIVAQREGNYELERFLLNK